MIVLPQPQELSSLNDCDLHGLQSDDDFAEDDASSISSGSTSAGSNQCRRFYVNLRLEVNERLLSSSEDEENLTTKDTWWQRRQRIKIRKRRRGKDESNTANLLHIP